jgi:hypothetical protein
MDDEQIRQRFTILTWVISVTVLLAVATLLLVLMLSFQVAHLAEELSELVAAEMNENQP